MIKMKSKLAIVKYFLLFFLISYGTLLYADTKTQDQEYSQQGVISAASDFFGESTKALAEVIEGVFKKQGNPNGYITGTEGGGALGIGLRYGEGILHSKTWKDKNVYWSSPSIGFDAGGNISKVFILVYHLKNPNDIFQRIPGVGGSFYVVGGIGVNYQQAGDLILAPIRTGVGWRAGVNIDYMKFTDKKSWIPF
ncbi:DUF1134 domain-containing protein [Candidatus Nitrosacidococcus tergens]|nr:DUF1134 domain-containing protein [Candidatus Nitrosacidococcus tergens]